MNFGSRHTNNGMYDSVGIAEKIKTFPMEASPLQPDKKSFYARVVIAQMVAYFPEYGSVILQNKRRTKFQAIELNNYRASRDLV
eukprot:CAMPEP_0202006192 /NCGR_PEP_ID=MMETSP0905-20130828/11021_1 /ASSEMBLY_ACC=CAM_ASM_000554 /TAXON_ID=420261 /ORGANISM="Thalassiosira antarctica, Strain CCMP982" /LENGTH=83 /DNA_ID=CAMNT_0048563909 /DNA_START=40 /DNA_END=287 /DNA_ORIENTATION=+